MRENEFHGETERAADSNHDRLLNAGQNVEGEQCQNQMVTELEQTNNKTKMRQRKYRRE